MPSEATKILEYYQYQKSGKAPFVIYADCECLIKKEKIKDLKIILKIHLHQPKVSKHIPSGVSMSAISSFRKLEIKHDVSRDKDCMRKSCEFLREHVMKINYFKKKKMKLFTKEQQESYENAKICYICRKNLKINILRTKNIVKLDITVTAKGNYRSAAHTRITSKDSVPKKIPIAFCNGSNYDDHFIIKELEDQFEKQFTYLGENIGKYSSNKKRCYKS